MSDRGASSSESLPAELRAWCAMAVGSTVDEVLFRSGNLSRVVGVRLADGRSVVLKARPPARRHTGCVQVQRRLFAAGYPCPCPLAGPDHVAGWDVTAETYVPGGIQLPLDAAAPDRFALALARLVQLAPPAEQVDSVDPPPPWAAWDHAGEALWPRPAPGTADLNAGERSWVDDVAVRARRWLAAVACRPVVGHVDFESQNIRWQGTELHCVHDWDSVALRPEATIAGIAAVTYPATCAVAACAPVDRTAQFLLGYADARGRPWSAEEEEAAWAAGVWTLAYNAKVQLAEGTDRLAAALLQDVRQRLRLAGA